MYNFKHVLFMKAHSWYSLAYSAFRRGRPPDCASIAKIGCREVCALAEIACFSTYVTVLPCKGHLPRYSLVLMPSMHTITT